MAVTSAVFPGTMQDVQISSCLQSEKEPLPHSKQRVMMLTCELFLISLCFEFFI